MKFLLNMNVPRSLMYRLSSEGHQCRHVGDNRTDFTYGLIGLGLEII